MRRIRISILYVLENLYSLKLAGKKQRGYANIVNYKNVSYTCRISGELYDFEDIKDISKNFQVREGL